MKLMILDGNSVVNRAFYGVRPLTTREGLYTNAIFGFLNILQRMEQEERPDGVCVAFDLQGPTFPATCGTTAIRPPAMGCPRSWPSRCPF